ncbi:MAG: transcription termination/antitermination protein NusG [Pirellulales bacterium]|nr:transcription termination/antitermination protein NusG [Pirellulales bacterium]
MADELEKTAEEETVETSAESPQSATVSEAVPSTPVVSDGAEDAANEGSDAEDDQLPSDDDGDIEPEEDTRTDEELANVKEASLEGIVVSADADDDEESEAPDPTKREWFILKVQSNRENSISEALMRRVKIEGLEDYFGDIIVPTEKVSEFKGGKKRVVKRKLYPGYIVVHMQITDDSWFLVRETPGIGDFTGAAGKPTPMLDHEIAKIIELDKPEEEQPEKLNIRFKVGDRVKINDGTFESFEGDVDAIDEASGRVNVMINIFGRSTPVELEHWQIESV